MLTHSSLRYCSLLLSSGSEGVLYFDGVKFVLLEHHEVEQADGECEEADYEGHFDHVVAVEDVRIGVVHEEEEDQVNAELGKVLA